MQDHDGIVSRRRVFTQLLTALTFEQALRTVAIGDPDRPVLSVSCPSGVTYTWPVVPGGAYDIWRPAPGSVVMRSQADCTVEATSISVFLADVRAMLGAAVERLEHFALELHRTIANDAESRRARRAAQVDTGADFATMEGAVIEGHPYHPCYKSRIGFDAVDNMRYGPEFAAPIDLVWVAVEAAHAVVVEADGWTYNTLVRSQLPPGAIERFEEQLRSRGVGPGDHVWIPVHPWQFRRVVEPELIAGLGDGVVVVLGTAGVTYTAQQSIRTLQNVDDLGAHSVKLSLSIINTSTIRTMQPSTVVNAPAITNWISSIVQADALLQRLGFVVLREVAGAAFPPESSIDGPPGALSCLWRESVSPHLDAGEEAVPFTALRHLQPDGTPFIDPWVRRDGVDQWARQALTVVIKPLLHLVMAHGIALESHAQNLVIVHRDGRPVRLVARDLHGGLRLCVDRLADPGAAPTLVPSPDERLITDAAELGRFFHDILFFANLMPLSWFLEDEYGLPTTRFWEISAEGVSAYVAEHGQGRIDDDLDPFREVVRIGAQALGRLFPSEPTRYITAGNPLARTSGVSSSTVEQAREQEVAAT